MFFRGFPIPSFFLPIVSFILWGVLFLFYLPVLEEDLDYSRQIILANLYLSNIILILAWFLCGRIVFLIFVMCFSIANIYLMLSLAEWGMGVHLLTMGVLYFWLKHITDKIEDERLGQMMKREKIQEDLNIAQGALEDKDRLIQALDRKLHRLRYMRQFSDHLKEAVDLTQTGRIITDEVASLIPEADQVLLYVSEDAGHELGLIASTTRHPDFEVKEKKGDQYDEWVMKRSQPLLIEDAEKDFRFMTDENEKAEFKSICLVPLLSKSTMCGVLHLKSVEREAFNTDDIRLLDIVADLSSAVIRNILLYEKTRALSIMDSLTECYLLRYVQERIAEEVQRSMRAGTAFSIIMADIDYFKKLNDEFGHRAGDSVLKLVAKAIKSKVGPSDIVGRYGGEEFVVALPQKDASQAGEIAESIRSCIEGLEVQLRGKICKVTVSLGVAEFPEDGASSEELIWKADNRLYEAKKRGRNRVCGSI